MEAVRHAQAAQDWPHAARLLADSCLGLILDGRTATVRGLLAAFPPDAVEAYPELAVAFAKSRLHDGRLDESAAYLAAAERLTNRPEERGGAGPPAGEASWRCPPAGDLGTVLERCSLWRRRSGAAAERRPDNDLRAAALMNLGIAELWSLRLDDARRDLEQALALARRIERPYLEIGCLAHLGFAAPLSEACAARSSSRSWRSRSRGARMGSGSGRGRSPCRERPRAGVARALRRGRSGSTARIVPCGRRRARHRADRPPCPRAVRFAQGRFEAPGGVPGGQRMQALLASEHPLTNELRNRILQTRSEWARGCRARRARMAPTRRSATSASRRHHALAEGDPQAAVERSPVIEPAPVLTRHGPRSRRRSSTPPPARARRRRAAEASIERALSSRAEGIILPFALPRPRAARAPAGRTATPPC